MTLRLETLRSHPTIHLVSSRSRGRAPVTYEKRVSQATAPAWRSDGPRRGQGQKGLRRRSHLLPGLGGYPGDEDSTGGARIEVSLDPSLTSIRPQNGRQRAYLRQSGAVNPRARVAILDVACGYRCGALGGGLPAPSPGRWDRQMAAHEGPRRRPPRRSPNKNQPSSGWRWHIHSHRRSSAQPSEVFSAAHQILDDRSQLLVF